MEAIHTEVKSCEGKAIATFLACPQIGLANPYAPAGMVLNRWILLAKLPPLLYTAKYHLPAVPFSAQLPMQPQG